MSEQDTSVDALLCDIAEYFGQPPPPIAVANDDVAKQIAAYFGVTDEPPSTSVGDDIAAYMKR